MTSEGVEGREEGVSKRGKWGIDLSVRCIM